MNTVFNSKLAEGYTSKSQKVRVMSESWTAENIFCPNCGNSIENLENNKKVSDFLCKKCFENFEQKASQKKFKGKVISSDYATIVRKLNTIEKPHFFFLRYIASNYFVEDFFVVPKYFFVPEIIEKRKALSKTVRRAGYVGSYILFSKIPDSGKIYYRENGIEISKKDILEKWQKTTFLKTIKKSETRGWILDIMNCLELLDKQEFSLSDVYVFEYDLKKLHPENNNIQAKIRQQLQFLRDKNYLKFSGKGKYRLT